MDKVLDREVLVTTEKPVISIEIEIFYFFLIGTTDTFPKQNGENKNKNKRAW